MTAAIYARVSTDDKPKFAWPIQVQSLAPERDTRISMKGKRATWLLYIAGPFCFLHPAYNGLERCAGALSALLALPIDRFSSKDEATRGCVCTLRVIVSQEEHARIREVEYRKAIRRR